MCKFSVRVMVFNATFNNISVISWQSVLLMEETKVPGENINLLQVTDKLREFKKCRNFATYIIVRQLILVMTIQ